MKTSHDLIPAVLIAVAMLMGCNDAQTKEPQAKEAKPAVTTAPAEAVAPSEFTSLQAYQQSLVKRCETSADCVVKNVGSCCGYTPQCVHKEVQTFPEQVKAMCEKEDRASICGFQEPAGCSCIDNQCRDNPAATLQ